MKISSKSHKSARCLARNAQRFQKFGWFLVDKFFELVSYDRSLGQVDDLAVFTVCTENKIDFWNRLTFLNNHLILLRGLKEHFSGNSVKISDCCAVPGCSVFDTANGCIRKNLHSYNMTLTFPVLDILCFQNFD